MSLVLTLSTVIRFPKSTQRINNTSVTFLISSPEVMLANLQSSGMERMTSNHGGNRGKLLAQECSERSCPNSGSNLGPPDCMPIVLPLRYVPLNDECTKAITMMFGLETLKFKQFLHWVLHNIFLSH